jgi:hypothetical protein
MGPRSIIGDVRATDMENDGVRKKWDFMAGICSREKCVCDDLISLFELFGCVL